jgi:ubiquinone/menaquinone biosynthesis C-methylase UbiE
MAIAFAVIAFNLGQCRKPRGPLGRVHIAAMNQRHIGVTRWGLNHLQIEPAFAILDVGCGGGKAVERLAAMAPQGKVCGVDYSAASVAAARATNARAIAEGRVEVQQASVSALPFADATFDLVTAVETHYYWPDPANDLREILRVLKPGGRLAIIAETYRGQTLGALMIVPMTLLRARYLTVEEHRQLLTAAGFAQVVVDIEPPKGWIYAAGLKP